MLFRSCDDTAFSKKKINGLLSDVESLKAGQKLEGICPYRHLIVSGVFLPKPRLSSTVAGIYLALPSLPSEKRTKKFTIVYR